MDIKHLHSTRFLPAQLMAVLIMALSGCAGTPEEPEMMEEPEVVEAPAPVEPAPQPVVLKPDYPEKYVVVKGDTLWDISARFLKDPWMWPKLWHFNQHIANPHLIYPGDILTIVFIDGRPTLQVTRNGKVINIPTDIPAEVARTGQEYPTVKLSPRVREQGLDEAIQTIPIRAVGAFLSRPRIVEKGELEAAPYVMNLGEKHLMSGGGYKVYVRGLKKDGLQGNYIIVREGEAYRNPKDSDDILGHEAIYLGEARLMSFGDPSIMRITDSAREVMRGDRLIPKGDELTHHRFIPRAPEAKVSGQIISVVDGVSMVGQYQVVVLNLGRQDDMEPGHVLAVNQTGKQVADTVVGGSIDLPVERAGSVMVFRVFDRVSYAVVMEASKSIRIFDEVTTPSP